jgi:hypothetical protein
MATSAAGFPAQPGAEVECASHYAQSAPPCQGGGRLRSELVERLALDDASICVEADGPSN